MNAKAITPLTNVGAYYRFIPQAILFTSAGVEAILMLQIALTLQRVRVASFITFD